jgi:rhomboid protease GluP
MKRQIGFRIRHLFLPALLLAVGAVAVYLAAVWVLVEWTGLLPLDDELCDLWLPFGLSVLLSTLVFGPRLRLLKFEKKKSGDPAFFHGCVVAAMMIVPAMLLVPSVRELGWGLRDVADAGAISATAHERYYTLGSVCLERDAARFHGFASREGRSNTLVLHIYAAMQLCSHRFGKQDIWIGKIFRKSLSNGITERDVDAEAVAFELSSRAWVRESQPSGWTYVERLRPGRDRRNFAKAISGRSDGAPDAVILLPQSEPFGTRTLARVVWAAEVFGGLALLWLALLMWPKLNAAEVASVRQTGKLRPQKDVDLVWKLIFPSRQFYGAQLLFWLNVVVYLAMVFAGLGVVSFATDDLLQWGANHGPLTFGPENYGLVTSLFVHGGMMHLFNNMYGLVFAFFFLIPVARNVRLILCYLACGVAGSVASVWWNPHVVSVGASGAVLGLWGILVVLAALRDHRIIGAEKVILINVAIFGGLTLALGMLVPGIDNAAHIGGFACGLVLGIVLWAIEKISPDPDVKPRRPRRRKPPADAPADEP